MYYDCEVHEQFILNAYSNDFSCFPLQSYYVKLLTKNFSAFHLRKS